MARTAEAWHGLESLESRQLLTFVLWDGGGGDTSWDNPLNWSGDVLPGAADNVLIDAPGHPTIRRDQETTATIASLWSLDPISISAGTLSVATPWRQSAALSMSGGRIEGAGNLVLNGAFSWTGGTIAGGNAVKIQVLPGSTMTIGGDVTLNRQLVNNGEVLWQAGNLTVDSATILNLQDRSFLAQSAGTLSGTGAGAFFYNRGTFAADPGNGATTTVAIGFDNFPGLTIFQNTYPDPPPPPTVYPPGTVEARSGTLTFAGAVLEKQDAELTGGRWVVSNATLRLPGGDLDGADAQVVLNGATASFSQLESAQYIDTLTLSGGRAFTFQHLTSWYDHATQLVIDNPGMTTTLPAMSLAGIVVHSGNVSAPAGLTVSAVSVDAGTTLTIGGAAQFQQAIMDGAGLVRLTGTATWTSGEFRGSGALLVAAGATLNLTPGSQYYDPGYKTLTRRLINYGTVEWTDGGYYFESSLDLAGELVNRGTFIIHSTGFAMPYPIGAVSPAVINNLGTLVIDSPGMLLRGAGGGISLNNQGTVHLMHGSLTMNGRTSSGGSWIIDPGTELIFGGLAGRLNGATITNNGRVRVASVTSWSNTTITGTGNVLLTPYGRLTLGGVNTFTVGGEGMDGAGITTLLDGARLQVNGSYAPSGLNIGTGSVSVNGNLYLVQGTNIHITSSAAGIGGRLSATGTTMLGGGVTVDFTSLPAVGVAFDFLTAPTHTGSFIYVGTSLLPGSGRGVQFGFVGPTGRVTVVAT